MSVLVEFISERKVVKTLDNIESTKWLLVELAEVYNYWQLSNFEPSVLWDNVADIMKVRVDPFLRLSIRIKSDNKVVYRKVVWKNTVK
jgi:hypothetical protein